MLQQYLDEFASLNTNKHLGVIAPHKPVLLLSVIDLFESGQLHDGRIELTESLEKAFHRNWQRYVGNLRYFRPNIDKPYWHLRNEPFWKLITKTGDPVESIKSPYSVTTLRESVYAVIDEELVFWMKNDESRELLRKELMDKYLRSTELISVIVPMILCANILMNIAS
jgi:putative restriction endonuclease